MKKELIKVVICDDHSIFREGIKAALNTTDEIAIIGEADNGLNLLKLLKHVKPDIILLDINMPVMDGFETLKQLKQLYPDLKVIVLSWNNDLTWVSSMMNLGANAYLTKDDESSHIIEAIKTCYTREFYMNEITEKGIKSTLKKATLDEIPVTKFQEERVETEVKKVAEDSKISIPKSLGRGLLYGVGTIVILAGLFYIWIMLKNNLNLFENFVMP